jgi:hypothetical protein
MFDASPCVVCPDFFLTNSRAFSKAKSQLSKRVLLKSTDLLEALESVTQFDHHDGADEATADGGGSQSSISILSRISQ